MQAAERRAPEVYGRSLVACSGLSDADVLEKLLSQSRQEAHISTVAQPMEIFDAAFQVPPSASHRIARPDRGKRCPVELKTDGAGSAVVALMLVADIDIGDAEYRVAPLPCRT